MKVAVLIDNLKGGGMERRCLQMVKGLVNRQVSVDLILCEKNIEYPEVFCLPVNIHYLPQKSKLSIGIFWGLYKNLKLVDPDVTIVWSLKKMSYYFFCVFPFIRTKYVSAIVTGGMEYKVWNKRFMRDLIFKYQADAIVGNSQMGLNNRKAPINKANLIYNGFDFSRESKLENPYDIKVKLGINTKYSVCMVAGLRPDKDYYTYVDAACKVLDYRNDVTFLCVGRGVLEQSIRARIPLKYKSKIIMTGFRTDVDDIQNMCDISVLCSNNKIHLEGVSNTILEAMAFGTPVIATTGGGTDEIIVNNETGYIIPPYDCSELAMRINLLLDSEDLRNMMSFNSKQRVYKYFSLDNMVNQYYNLFLKLTNGKNK